MEFFSYTLFYMNMRLNILAGNYSLGLPAPRRLCDEPRYDAKRQQGEVRLPEGHHLLPAPSTTAKDKNASVPNGKTSGQFSIPSTIIELRSPRMRMKNRIVPVTTALIASSLLWITPSPASEPMAIDDSLFGEALQAANQMPRLHSLLISHNGNLILEEYFNGQSPRRTANVKSVSKSVMSALIGIAIERGHVPVLSNRYPITTQTDWRERLRPQSALSPLAIFCRCRRVSRPPASTTMAPGS